MENNHCFFLDTYKIRKYSTSAESRFVYVKTGGIESNDWLQRVLRGQ